jgi:deoxyribose-phosphate aldolase
MNIKKYLDSTYLKTPDQAGLDEEDNLKVLKGFVLEAIEERFKLIMIRPNMVSLARKMISDAGSDVQIGTVIDFPEGKSTVSLKLAEAKKAIEDGADDLDFVCNYEAFKNGNINLLSEEVLKCTQLGIENNKVVKWIIETAALKDRQIVQLTNLIKNVVITNFKEDDFSAVFVKSSTGFYKTENSVPNGATRAAIILMLENAAPLSVKAAGGVRTYEEAIEMLTLGVKRIGTSGAKAIARGEETNIGY